MPKQGFALGEIRDVKANRFFKDVSNPNSLREHLKNDVGVYENSTLLIYRFESLPRILSEEDTPALLLTYNICISHIMELISLESDPFILESLENILHQIRWQQQRFQAAYACGISEDYSEKLPVHIQSPDAKAKISKDRNANFRQEVIRLAHCHVSESGLSDLIGLEEVKHLLKRSVLLPLSFPALFKGGRKAWTQLLLYGPPGTGKSKIAYALAAECKAELYKISSADLLSSWVGESEKMIKDLFRFARSNKEKCIVFIDEIDSICRKRNAKEGDHSRSIKNQLLIEFDENLRCEKNCFVLCATNCPWDIDVAFMRRFQCKIYVPLPNSTERIEIINKTCGEISTDIHPDEWNIIAEKTDGYSGADLVNLTNFALQEPLGELANNQSWILKNDKWIPCASNTPGCVKIPFSLAPPEKVELRNVMLKDFMKAIKTIGRTINENELGRYKEFSMKFC